MFGSATAADSSRLAYWQSAIRLTGRGWGEMLERRTVARNIAAGLTVTLVALPLNLALAIACGLPPSVGLVTGALAGLVCALFGGARFSITGPEIALAPITLEIVARYGVSGLFVATFLAGLMQVAFGLFRVGGLVNAIPMPVVGGFLAAVGLLVFDAQIPRLLGLPSDVTLLSKIDALDTLRSIDVTALAIGVLVVLTMVLLPRFNRKVPAPLAGLALAVTAASVLGLEVHAVQPIDGTWPTPSLPGFHRVDVLALLPEALALALLASIDSLLCAVSVDTLAAGERTRTDQELCAQGLANMVSACFGGMPVAAAVVRSVAAVQAGASSRLAPVVQSLALALVLLVFAPLVSYIPLVSLAAILLVVGFRLIQWRNLLRMWHVARLEAFVFVVTAAGILFTDFVFGVAIGMIGALAHFAVQQGAVLRARKTMLAVDASGPARQLEGGVPVVRLEGPLFFGSQAQLEDAISHAEARETLHVDVSKVSTVDVSGALAFANALKRIADEGVCIRVIGRDDGLDPVLSWGLAQVGHPKISIAETALARSSHEPSALALPRRSALSSVQTGVYPTIQIERS